MSTGFAERQGEQRMQQKIFTADWRPDGRRDHNRGCADPNARGHGRRRQLLRDQGPQAGLHPGGLPERQVFSDQVQRHLGLGYVHLISSHPK